MTNARHAAPKRFHVSLTVADLDQSVAFYSRLFAASPVIRKTDYAKWMLDDPRINFSLSTRGTRTGVDHVGLEVTSKEDFDALRERFASGSPEVFDQVGVECCYAKSTKAWVRDPDGVAWEGFVSFAERDTYGDGTFERAADFTCIPSVHLSAVTKDPLILGTARTILLRAVGTHPHSFRGGMASFG